MEQNKSTRFLLAVNKKITSTSLKQDWVLSTDEQQSW